MNTFIYFKQKKKIGNRRLQNLKVFIFPFFIECTFKNLLANIHTNRLNIRQFYKKLFQEIYKISKKN